MDAIDVINRARNLQEFEVIVEVPAQFQFRGTIPFDMEISGGQAFVTVLAETIEEATQRAQDFFNGVN